MSSIRQNKVARLLQKELATIFQQNGADWFPNTMVSVTTIRLAPDLGFAKVYLSVFGKMEPKACVTLVNEHSKMIRGDLGRRIKNQLRMVPEIAFYLDDSLDYAEEIEQLLKNS